MAAVAATYAVVLIMTVTPLAFAISDSAAEATEPAIQEFTEEEIAAAQEVADAIIKGELGPEALEGYDTEFGWLVTGLITASLIVSFAIGSVVGKLLNKDSTPGGGDQTQVDNYAQSMEALKIDYANSVLTPALESLLDNDSNMLNFTRTYFARQMEFIAAYDWDKDKEYKPDNLMQDAKIRKNLDFYIYNWQHAIDESYNDFASNQKEWTSDALKSMTFKYFWGTNSYSVDTDGKSYCVSDICSAVTAKSNTATVYLDVTENGGEQSNSVYIFGKNAAYLRDPTTGNKVVELYPGKANDISGLSSGVYMLDEGVTYAGEFLHASDTESIELSGAFVLGNGKYLVTPNGSGVKVVTYSTSSKENFTEAITSDFGFKIEYTDTNNTRQTYKNDLCGILTKYDAMLDTAELIIADSVAAGQTCWNIYDICEESSTYIHPSSIMMTLADSGMTSTEIQVQYINAMSSIATLYNTNREALTDAKIDESADAFALLVYGDILYNGAVVEGCENIIFTPYAYTNSVYLTVGQTTSWAQAGFATIWGTATSQADFQSQKSITANTSPKTIVLADGFTFEVKGITANGVPQESYVMKQTEIVKSDYTIKDHDTFDVPQVLNANILVMLLIIETGLFMAYIGLTLGLRILVIIGLIVAVVGFLWPQAVVNLCLGQFEWSDLVPFGWL